MDQGRAESFASNQNNFEYVEHLVFYPTAIARRSSGEINGVIKLNRMSVDLVGKQLRIDDAHVELTAREWLVFECLVRRVGLIVSKERLQQAVANPDHDLTANAVEVHISRLRAKLGQAAIVRSLRGLGYRLEESKPGLDEAKPA